MKWELEESNVKPTSSAQEKKYYLAFVLFKLLVIMGCCSSKAADTKATRMARWRSTGIVALRDSKLKAFSFLPITWLNKFYLTSARLGLMDLYSQWQLILNWLFVLLICLVYLWYFIFWYCFFCQFSFFFSSMFCLKISKFQVTSLFMGRYVSLNIFWNAGFE